MQTYKVTIDNQNTTCWYNHKDQRHRVDGPAVERADGSKFWYLNGKRHRVDGPAIEDADGSKYWYLNDKLHREDGPAIEGTKGYKRWYINDRQLTEEEFNEYNKLKQPVEVKDIKVLHNGKWYKLTAI